MEFRLKEMRQRRGYSQEDLADILDVSQSQISRWESNASIDVYELPRLCRILECTLDELMSL